MTTQLPTTKIPAGRQVAVEVYDLPGGTKTLTYRAGSDVRIGDIVLVPAPAWAENATKFPEFAGRVLGTPESPLSKDAPIRSTMPLYVPETPANGSTAAGARQTAAELRKRAEGLEAVAAKFRAAADILEQVG